jgi:hypothetical protein
MGWMDLNIEHCLMGGPSDYIARRWIILALLILGGEGKYGTLTISPLPYLTLLVLP